MLSKKAPALIAVAALSAWLLLEGRHQGGGGSAASTSPSLADTPLSASDSPSPTIADILSPSALAAQALQTSLPSVATPAIASTSARPTVEAEEAWSIDTEVARGASLGTTLHGIGISGKEIAKLAGDTRKVHDVARLAAGTPVRAVWHGFVAATPNRVEIKLDERRTLIADRADEGAWHAAVHEASVESQLAAYAGVVTSTLWSSASVAGMDPNLIHKLAEVFAWQVDFNREVQEGDRWRLTVEKRFIDGKAVGFGDIVAAEYENDGQVYTAVRYTPHRGFTQYYAPDGASLRRMFLKSPLRYAHITSGFTSRRFHPVLKVMKAHLGVDYGAPTGTPIMAVGDGIVQIAAMRGGSGNMVEIRHNAIFLTAYKHLSRFAAGIRPGARVQMGQIIGYVGSTGLATGPHLHFEFHEAGRVRDPQGIRFPSADPVPPAEAPKFAAFAAHATAELPPWSATVLSEGPTAMTGATAE